MIDWLNRILLIVISVVVATLTLTSLPTFFEEHMEGQRLMIHMMAGGTLVFALPLFGMLFLGRVISPTRSTGLQRLGFWLLIVGALVAITSVLLCMMPLLSTEQMERWMSVHGYAGLATVPGLLLLVIGGVRWRRMQATRSATPG